MNGPLTAQRNVYYDQVKGFLNSSDLSIKESDTFIDCHLLFLFSFL